MDEQPKKSLDGDIIARELTSFSVYKSGPLGGIVLRQSNMYVNDIYQTMNGDIGNAPVEVDIIVAYNTELKNITVSCSNNKIDCLELLRHRFGPDIDGNINVATTAKNIHYEFGHAKFIFWDICDILGIKHE